MEKFGHFLKAEREKKGIHLEEIASITKINLRILTLLEDSKWEELPPDPFIRGFIVAYAKYVGLDGRDALRRYLEEKNVGGAAPQDLQRVESPSKNPHEVMLQSNAVPIKKLAMVGALVVLVVVAGIVISIGKENAPAVVQVESKPTPKAEVAAASQIFADAPVRNPTFLPSPVLPTEIRHPAAEFPIPTIPPAAPAVIVHAMPKIVPPVELKPASPTVTKPVPSKIVEKKIEAPKIAEKKIEETTKPKEKKTDEAESTKSVESGASSPHDVVIESTDRSWIKVVVDDKPPQETFLSKGEKSHYSAQKKLKIVLGNSAVAKVVHNGEITKGEKLNGTIRTFIFPKGARFPQDIPRKTASSRLKTEEPTPEPIEDKDL